MQYTGDGTAEGTEGDAMVRQLQKADEAIDEKLSRSQVRLFSGGAPMRADDAGSDSDEEEDDDDVEEGDEEEDGEDEEEGSEDGDEEMEEDDEEGEAGC